jgi:hypothetical protein
MGMILALVYTQLILIPILGFLLLGMRRERQIYETYAKEVLNQSWDQRNIRNMRR